MSSEKNNNLINNNDNNIDIQEDLYNNEEAYGEFDNEEKEEKAKMFYDNSFNKKEEPKKSKTEILPNEHKFINKKVLFNIKNLDENKSKKNKKEPRNKFLFKCSIKNQNKKKENTKFKNKTSINIDENEDFSRYINENMISNELTGNNSNINIENEYNINNMCIEEEAFNDDVINLNGGNQDFIARLNSNFNLPRNFSDESINNESNYFINETIIKLGDEDIDK